MWREWLDAAYAFMDGGLRPLLYNAAQVVALLLMGLVAMWLVRFAFGRARRWAVAALSEEDKAEGERRVNTLLGILQTMAVAALWVAVVIMVLSELGLDITPILAGAGILGLAVGFGAQNLVRDLITGFFLIMEDQVRVGDVAQINGIGGVVERITFRVVTLRDLAGSVHVVPHGKIDTLSNMTKDFSYALLDIGVAYKENTDRVVEVMREVCDRMAAEEQWRPLILEPLEVMGVNDFADSAVIVRVRIKTVPLYQWSVGREYRRRLKMAFDQRGIEIPFPHRTLYVAPGTAEVPVRMRPVEEDEAAATAPAIAPEGEQPAALGEEAQEEAADPAEDAGKGYDPP